MAAESRATLKSYFETGDVPSQAQFANLIDSFYSLVSDFKLMFGTLTQTGTNDPVLTAMFNSLGFVPTFPYASVGTFTITSVGNLDVAKTVIIIPTYGDGTIGIEVVSNTSPDTFDINTYDPVSIPANGVLNATPILLLKIP